MEMHGGTVAAYSDGPGKGSTLRFNLPLSNEAPAPSVEAAAGVSQRGLRILIIEDNPDAAESVRMLLSLDGHLVETADDGPRGLERARELRPHVVLCDIGLPVVVWTATPWPVPCARNPISRRCVSSR